MAQQDETPTLYEWCGGLPALQRMTRLFYSTFVPADPLLAPIFSGMSADHADRVATWLAEVFGGPADYTARYGGYPRMLSQHLGKRLTEEARARWVGLLSQSATEAGLPNDAEFRSALVSYLERGSHIAVENSDPDAHPPPRMPVPHWDWGTAGPPGARVSALSPTEDRAPVTGPADDEDVGFERHVRPPFRESDRRSMRSAFDLWSHADVSTHAAAILRELEAGSMPCDGAWPAVDVTTFKRWIDDGMTP